MDRDRTRVASEFVGEEGVDVTVCGCEGAVVTNTHEWEFILVKRLSCCLCWSHIARLGVSSAFSRTLFTALNISCGLYR